MTAPVAIGLARDEKHGYYWNGAGPLTSITTALKAIDKPAIVGWAKRITAEAAVKNLDLIHRQAELAGEQAAVDFLKRLADHKRDKAADLGTRVHALAEAIARGQDVVVTDDEAPYLAAYRQWIGDWRPRFIAAEYLVCSLTHRYGGTGDLVVEMGGERWRLDTKTSTGVYRETGLQLAAAHFAEFSGRPGDPKRYAVPDATQHGVLHLRPDGTYAVVPFEVTQETFAAFLAALRLWEWLQGEAKTIVGQPIQRQEIAA